MPDWFFIPLQWGICTLARTGASLLWMLNQVWLLIAAMFYYLRWWLEQSLLNTLLTALFGPDNVANAWIPASLALAVLLGGSFLVLRNLGISHSPVNLRKAAGWLLFLGFLFANHTWLFTQLEAFRNGIAGAAYATAGDIRQGIMSGAYAPPGGELPNPHTGPLAIPHLFPQTTGPYGGSEITALDLAAYSMEATETDIVQPPITHPPLPAQFDQDYYNNGDFFPLFPPADNDTRNRAVNKALLGMGLMVINFVPSFVALIAAGISFGLALTAAVLFCSLPLTLPFVFFEATEGLALGILRAYLLLVVKTWIINLILAIFLGFNAYWAESGNVGLFVAMSFITLYFCWQFQALTRQTFFQAINAITGGIGQAVGVRMPDPVRATGEFAGRATGAAIGAAAVIATGGAAAPAVAGALLSTVGARSGGQALLYGATRHQREPGEFARRGLLARQSSAAPDLTPEEQRLATQAAAIQTGLAAGDPAWAAQTLGQLGQRVQQRRAADTALRQTLAQSGILPPEEALRASAGAGGRQHAPAGVPDLRDGALTPAELEEVLAAAAVLDGTTPGDPAQAMLERVGRPAQRADRRRRQLRASLAAAGIVPPAAGEREIRPVIPARPLVGPPSALRPPVAVPEEPAALPVPDDRLLDGTAAPQAEAGAPTMPRTPLGVASARRRDTTILPPLPDLAPPAGLPPPVGATLPALPAAPEPAPLTGEPPSGGEAAAPNRVAPPRRRRAPQTVTAAPAPSTEIPETPAPPTPGRTGSRPPSDSPPPAGTPMTGPLPAEDGRAGDSAPEEAEMSTGTGSETAPAPRQRPRNPGYWAWRAQQPPGAPLNKPRGKRTS